VKSEDDAIVADIFLRIRKAIRGTKAYTLRLVRMPSVKEIAENQALKANPA